jgi:hypothetical protein
MIPDGRFQHSLPAFLPVARDTGFVVLYSVVVVVELLKKRTPLFVALVEHLVGDSATKDWLEAVANLGFRDGIPHAGSRLFVVEVGLSTVVGDDVDEGGC